MNKLLFLDVETTGKEKDDRLVQVAFRGQDELTITEVDRLFKAPLPISLEAMSINHITNRMVEDCEAFEGSETQDTLRRLNEQGYIFVAHNAQFDLEMLKKEGVTFDKHICTFKIARHIDVNEDLPQHKMQYLRYYYDIDIHDAIAHNAFGDVVVLEQVFAKQVEDLRAMYPELNDEQLIEKMVAISELPILFKKFRFGKYNGDTIADVARKDGGYLQWLLKEKMKSPAGEEDWIYTLKYYLQ